MPKGLGQLGMRFVDTLPDAVKEHFGLLVGVIVMLKKQILDKDKKIIALEAQLMDAAIEFHEKILGLDKDNKIMALEIQLMHKDTKIECLEEKLKMHVQHDKKRLALEQEWLAKNRGRILRGVKTKMTKNPPHLREGQQVMCDCRSVFDDDGGIDLIGPFVILFYAPARCTSRFPGA